MGQYYRYLNIDKQEYFNPTQGAKLLEHAYTHCPDVRTLRQLLASPWRGDRIVHVGDYANGNDRTQTAWVVEDLEKELGIGESNLYGFAERHCSQASNCGPLEKYSFTINLSKSQYIDLRDCLPCYIIESSGTSEATVTALDPLTLLITAGNGLGGGDYSGTNEGKVGRWVGDRLECSNERPEDMEEVRVSFCPYDSYVYISETSDTEETKGIEEAVRELVRRTVCRRWFNPYFGTPRVKPEIVKLVGTTPEIARYWYELNQEFSARGALGAGHFFVEEDSTVSRIAKAHINQRGGTLVDRLDESVDYYVYDDNKNYSPYRANHRNAVYCETHHILVIGASVIIRAR